MTESQVVRELDSDILTGLDDKQIQIRQNKYGKNVLDKPKTESILVKVLKQLSDVTAIILLIAAGIAFYAAVIYSESYVKVIAILSIVIINIWLSIYQESSAEKALKSLQNMSAEYSTTMRNGVVQNVETKELVLGDILLLNAGDIVPADVRVLECNNLRVNESFLTGESESVEKQNEVIDDSELRISERSNMLFSGSAVTNGTATAIVCETGMKTEIGSIARLIGSTKKKKTLLQNRLARLTKRISFIALIAGLIILILDTFVYRTPFIDSLMVSIALAVAAVPETLPVIVTITLSFGIQRMVKKNAIIRRISAVETIGNVSVICSDKTGTLTQNRMTIQEIWKCDYCQDKIYSEDKIYSSEEFVLIFLTLCSNATSEKVDNKIIETGDPTELAIIKCAENLGLSKSVLNKMYPRIYEHSFDSNRKLMSVINKIDGRYVLITKGAPEKLPVKDVDNQKLTIQEKYDEFAKNALRVISVGYKYLDEIPEDINWQELENDLVFLGMVGMIDPPRIEVQEAVERAKQAGIRTVMVTGDHLKTAQAVARKIGILNEGDKSITGNELYKLSQDELEENIYSYSVYARTVPEDKIRIVNAWQSKGKVVVMTGDGVNDAPALKAADVGAVMGITGTDVSKDAADIILTDDNFATIVDAVSSGRVVYDNILKAVYFLLSVNFGEIFIMLLAIIFGWGTPVIAVQLLFINVIADGIPGFYLSREKAEHDVMHRKPIRSSDSIFSNGLGQKITIQSILYVITTLVAFYIGQFINLGNMYTADYHLGVTMAFYVLTYSSILDIFNVRSKMPIFRSDIKSNKPLLLSVLFSILCVIAVTVIPFLSEIFSLVPLNIEHWIITIMLSLCPLIVQNLIKYTRREDVQSNWQVP